jgi:hypothetical protein
MSTRRIMIVFEHPRCEIVVDVHLPLPEPIETGLDAMAERVRPACPICKEPMPYIAWNFSDTEEEDPS